MERIYLTKKELEDFERRMIITRHIERYSLIRQFLCGNILDCACGVGYGTYLCSQNPDVNFAYGVDLCKDAIDFAQKNYNSEKIRFIQSSISEINIENIDILISLETIEHLDDPEEVVKLANRLGVSEIFVSFPTKRTTHYNKYHKYDFVEQDLLDLFSNFVLNQKFNQVNEFMLMHFIASKYAKKFFITRYNHKR